MKRSSVRNLIKCPKCESGDTKKLGWFRRKRNRQHIQRYACNSCGATFSDQTFSKTYKQKRPDLNREILELVCIGTGIRKTSKKVRTTKNTVQRKIKFLATLCDSFHRKYMSQWKRSPKPRFQFDELETIETRRSGTLTVPLVVEKDSHFIVGTIAAYDSSGSHYPRAKNRHNLLHKNEIQRKNDIIKDQITLCRKMKPEGRIVIETDCAPSYPRYMKDLFEEKGVHIRYLASKEDEKGKLFPVNNAMACLRADKAMLRRESWHICKDKDMLSEHLKLYTFFSNYQKQKGYKEKVIDPETGKFVMLPSGKPKKKVFYKTPAQHLGIFNCPVETKFLLDNC